MSLHGWVTAGLAVGFMGLAVLVGARPMAAAGTAQEDDPLEARILRVERELEEALRTLSSRPRVQTPTGQGEGPHEADSATAAEQPPGEGKPSDVEMRVAALERDLAVLAARAGIEMATPESLSTEDLLAAAKSMSSANQKGQRGIAACQAEEAFWREALTRTLTDEQRFEGLYYLGISLRGQKRHGDELQIFEQLLEHAGGIETEQGASAGFQIAWAQVYGGDTVRAVDSFERVANSAGSASWLRANSLLRAGYYAIENGEESRARADLERLLADHRNDVPASQAWVITSAEQYLRKLNGE